MKKSLLKLVFSAFAAVLMFTSCLSDGDSTTERSGAFAYIKYDMAKGQYAAVEGVHISSPFIKTLDVGECYLIGFRTSFEQDAAGIYKAEDIAQPVRLLTLPGRVESASFMEDTFNPTAFEPRYAFYNDFLGDRWGFIYRVKLKEKDTPRAFFFYDTEKQYEMVDGVRKDVEKNQLIIDVRFDFIPGADGSSVERNEVTVGDLGEIKNSYKNASPNFEWSGTTNDGTKYAQVAIKFRYNQLQSDGTVKNDVYVGQWSSNPYMFEYYETKE